MRFTRKEWERHGDGEFIEHLGLTGIKKSIARLGIKTPLAPLAMSLGVHRFLIRRAEVAPETTGAFLTAVLNNANGRIEADEHYRRGILTGVGAAIQSLWLTATAVGASLQFQTSTIVQKGPKAQLRSILSIPSDHEPLFLIRMGYPNATRITETSVENSTRSFSDRMRELLLGKPRSSVSWSSSFGEFVFLQLRRQRPEWGGSRLRRGR